MTDAQRISSLPEFAALSMTLLPRLAYHWRGDLGSHGNWA